MKKKIGKSAIITISLGLMIGIQVFSSSVFSESSTPQAFEDKNQMDKVLASALLEMPKDPVLAAHLEAIFKEEADYKVRIENYWAKAKTQTAPELSMRNQLLRESHVTDAHMLPLFKALRCHLKDQNLDRSLATIVEQQYEATKRWLILYEKPNL
jgi:hypothetical protein